MTWFHFPLCVNSFVLFQYLTWFWVSDVALIKNATVSTKLLHNNVTKQSHSERMHPKSEMAKLQAKSFSCYPPISCTKIPQNFEIFYYNYWRTSRKYKAFQRIAKWKCFIVEKIKHTSNNNARAYTRVSQTHWVQMFAFFWTQRLRKEARKFSKIRADVFDFKRKMSDCPRFLWKMLLAQPLISKTKILRTSMQRCMIS